MLFMVIVILVKHVCVSEVQLYLLQSKKEINQSPLGEGLHLGKVVFMCENFLFGLRSILWTWKMYKFGMNNFFLYSASDSS